MDAAWIEGSIPTAPFSLASPDLVSCISCFALATVVRPLQEQKVTSQPLLMVLFSFLKQAQEQDSSHTVYAMQV